MQIIFKKGFGKFFIGIILFLNLPLLQADFLNDEPIESISQTDTSKIKSLLSVHVERGWPTLSLAIKYGNRETIQHLVELGLDTHATDGLGWTALHLASSIRNKDLVQYFLEQGIDVNIQSDDHWTALHVANFQGDIEIIKHLIEAGADIHVVTEQGHLPATYASYAIPFKKRLQMLDLFLQAGLDVNIQNQKGETALHLLVQSRSRNKHKELIQYFVQKSGADIFAKDFKGRTALDIAIALGYDDVAKFFIDQGLTKSKSTQPAIPAVVSLHHENNLLSEPFCSGTYIGNHQVITALHCLKKGYNQKFFVRFSKSLNKQEGQMFKAEFTLSKQKLKTLLLFQDRNTKQEAYKDWIVFKIQDQPKDITPFQLIHLQSFKELEQPVRNFYFAGYPSNSYFSSHYADIGLEVLKECSIEKESSKLKDYFVTGNCLTSDGSSGGPLFYKDKNGLYLVGILTSMDIDSQQSLYVSVNQFYNHNKLY